MAVIQGQNLVVVKPSAWGQIMERLTKLQRRLFASATRARKIKDRLERAKLVVATARDRAAERTAQQCAGPSMERPPTVAHRRRLAEMLSD
jgi:hypothetical protein